MSLYIGNLKIELHISKEEIGYICILIKHLILMKQHAQAD